jgi:hypothetical protein
MAEQDMADGCPSEVAGPVLSILYWAILTIRGAGRNNQSRYCAIEANHIHNLPGLLRSYSREALKYYLDIERPSYIRDLEELPNMGSVTEEFRPMWAELERYLRREPE